MALPDRDLAGRDLAVADFVAWRAEGGAAPATLTLDFAATGARRTLRGLRR